MSNSANQLGGKCPYMPYLGRGQMSGGGGGERPTLFETYLECLYASNIIMLISMVRSKKCKQKEGVF